MPVFRQTHRPSWLSAPAIMVVAEHLPFSPPGPTGANWDAVAQETRRIVEKMQSGTIEDSEGVAALNKCLRSFSQIRFFGQEETIWVGDGKFPRELRAQFFNERAGGADYDEAGETDVPAISSEDLDEFQAWMGSYGF